MSHENGIAQVVPEWVTRESGSFRLKAEATQLDLFRPLGMFFRLKAEATSLCLRVTAKATVCSSA